MTFHSDGYDSLVVKSLDIGRVFLHRFEERVHNGLRREFAALLHNLLHLVAAEQISIEITGIENSVAKEHEHIAWLCAERELVVVGVIEEAERQTSGLNDFDLAIMDVQRPRQAGVRHLQRTMRVIPYRVDQRDELAVNAALANFSKGLSKLGMRDGINVNVIHPGNTATERQDELLAQRAAATGKSVEELRAAALAKSGVRRIGQVDDVAALALFLCSERARHIQGTATAIDGGATVGYY